MKKLLIIVLFSTLLISLTKVASAADWQAIDFDNEIIVFFDKQSLKKTSSSTYTVWLKWKYSEIFKKKMMERQSNKKVVSHTLDWWEIDYKNEQVRFLRSIEYGEDSSVISDDNSWSAWQKVVPDSFGDSIFILTSAYYSAYYQ